MKAMVVSVGDEILRGEVTDTNAGLLARHLEAREVEVAALQAVGDDRESLRVLLQDHLGRIDLILMTGGLGPTKDDITRHVVAEAIGKPLEMDRPAWERIRRRCEAAGREMTDGAGSQSYFPVDAEILENPVGSAAGFISRAEGTTVVVLPGVPVEAEAMAEASIDRALEGVTERPRRGVRALSIVGLPESQVDTALGPLMDRARNPRIGLSVREGEIRLTITATGGSPEEVKDLLGETERAVREALGSAVTEAGGMERVLDRLREKGWKMGTAESCTGGLLADAITDIPGASDVFAGGAVAYTPQMKVDVLGVPRSAIDREGVVSEAVALEMAEAICCRTGAQVGVGMTGVAGPTGGTPRTPLGLVWTAIRYPGGTVTRRRVFRGGRRAVKEKAVLAATKLLLDCLTGIDGSASRDLG